MPVDNDWLEAQKFWKAGQEKSIQQLEENISHDKKEIELHTSMIEINSKIIEHYKNSLIIQEKLINDYLKENA